MYPASDTIASSIIMFPSRWSSEFCVLPVFVNIGPRIIVNIPIKATSVPSICFFVMTSCKNTYPNIVTIKGEKAVIIELSIDVVRLIPMNIKEMANIGSNIDAVRMYFIRILLNLYFLNICMIKGNEINVAIVNLIAKNDSGGTVSDVAFVIGTAVPQNAATSMKYM